MKIFIQNSDVGSVRVMVTVLRASGVEDIEQTITIEGFQSRNIEVKDSEKLVGSRKIVIEPCE